jgi:hypothetical protein
VPTAVAAVLTTTFTRVYHNTVAIERADVLAVKLGWPG